MSDAPRSELARTVLAILSLLALMVGSLWVMLAFLGPLIWATMIVVTTWPVMRKVEARLWGRRGLAVTVMTVILLLVLIIPLSLAVSAVVGNADRMVSWARSLATLEIQPPPEWLSRVPLVGAKLEQAWAGLDSEKIQAHAAKAAPYAATAAGWFVSNIGNVGRLVAHFLLTVVISAILFTSGEAAVEGVRRFMRRLAGLQGDHVVELAGRAIRAVALGVVVTAVVQSVLGGLGLVAVGIPFASLLSGLMLLLCIAQIGPVLVLVPSVLWLYSQGRSTAATVLLVWSIGVLLLDNILRPWLIKRGANLPMLLIFAGVIGGLISFGLIGVFAGPVILAVTYTLLKAWVNEGLAGDSAPGEAPAPAAPAVRG